MGKKTVISVAFLSFNPAEVKSASSQELMTQDLLSAMATLSRKKKHREDSRRIGP